MTPADPAGGRASPPVRDERQQMWADAGLGWVMAVEFLTATLTWGGIGWLVDRWLGTSPWLMCIGFVVGNGAGIYLLWLRSNAAEQARQDREGPRAGR